LKYAVDVHPYGVDRWITVLKMAHEEHGRAYANDAGYQAGIKNLLARDQQLK
jgi:hypothetical protein